MKIIKMILAVIFLMPALASAGLTFTNAGTTQVNISNVVHPSIKNLTAYTIAMWVYPTYLVNSGGDMMWAESNGTVQVGQFRIKTISTNNANITMRVTNGSGTTAQYEQADSTYYNNTWQFVSTTFDTVSGISRIYIGNLTSTVSEIGYGVQVTAGGIRADQANGGILWGNRGQLDSGFPGTIANAMFINKTLSLADLRRLQFDMRNTQETIVNMHLGFNGTGGQTDFSGLRNHGVLSGPVQGSNPGIRGMRQRP